MKTEKRKSFSPKSEGAEEHWLRSCGWRPKGGMWWHRKLIGSWHRSEALRLQREAVEGMKDYAHRRIMGED